MSVRLDCSFDEAAWAPPHNAPSILVSRRPLTTFVVNWHFLQQTLADNNIIKNRSLVKVRYVLCGESRTVEDA